MVLLYQLDFGYYINYSKGARVIKEKVVLGVNT